MITAASDDRTTELISVVLPIYRQADHLEDVVRAYQGSLGRLPAAVELILVVNGPDDASLAIARRLEAESPARVRVIASPTAGWGHAVRLGLAAAKGDVICYTNAARTSAQDLALVLMYAIAYPDVVIKVNRRVRDSLFRRLGSLLYNLECRMLFDLAYWDLNGTPKVFHRSRHELLALAREDELIDLEFNIVCRRVGYTMIEVPIISTRRHGGRSTTSVRTALFLYWGAFLLWCRSRRTATARDHATTPTR